MKKFSIGLMAAVAAAAIMVVPAGAANNTLKLKPSAFSCNGTGVGNGQNAQAQWTNKTSETGKFSVLLQKTADQNNCSGAAAVVDGVEGSTVGSLGSIGFSSKDVCGGGSPRFNLLYDNNGDGVYDGYAFYGCGNHVTGGTPPWIQMDADPLTPDAFVGQPITAASTVVQLYVIVDETGTYYVDNVQVGSRTVGEPNGS